MEKKNGKKNSLSSVSVIIPTLNEADYIGYLLFSLTRQTYRNFEVILSDGNSSDQTVVIAKSFRNQLPKLTVIISQKRSPAMQRNNGVKKAQYETLLFLDADTILPPDFLEKSLKEIKKKKLDLACPTSFPLTKKILDHYFHLIINWTIDLTHNYFPMAAGWAVFSSQKIHKELSGYDEKMNQLGEDVDYLRRSVKKGFKFGIIKSCSPFVSNRRLEYEGRAGTVKKIVTSSLYLGIFGKHEGQELVGRPYGNFQELLKNVEKKKSKSIFLKKLTKKDFNNFLKSLKKLVEI